MLNETIKVAAQTLTPMWSDSLLRTLQWDSRYSLLFMGLFNGIINYVHLSEYTAAMLLSLIAIAVTTGYYYNLRDTVNLGQLYARWRNRPRYVIRLLEYPCNHALRSLYTFLWEHPAYFVWSPVWLTLDIMTQRSADAKGNYYITATMPRLDWGNYQVNIDQHIVFTISVVKEIVDSPSINNNPNRLEYAVVTLCFLTGDLPELQHRMSAWSRQKETNSVGRMVFDYNLEMHLSSICLHLAKGDPAAFRGYYYRRLPELRTWLDQLMAPRPIAETSLLPIQINLLFYGPSGTGKTALARRLAEYTNRDLYLLDLTQIADKVGLYQALYPYSASSKILLLDELDKTLTTLEAIRQRRERRDQLALEMLTAIGPNREEERADKPAKKKKVEPEWVLDDLLGILCGAHVPHGRMVIATANDLDTISTLCPYLVRPGRLTPMAFEYGTADEFLAIVKEALSNGTTAAADLDNDTFHAWKRLESDIPKDYRFVQANLLEYLHSHPKVTVSELLRLLPEFKAPNPGT